MWTDVKSSYLNITNASSVLVVDNPTRLKAVWLHCESSGTLTCYDASAGTSATGPMTMRLPLPHSNGGQPDTVELLIPRAGIRHQVGLFINVNTSANARMTFFYD